MVLVDTADTVVLADAVRPPLHLYYMLWKFVNGHPWQSGKNLLNFHHVPLTAEVSSPALGL
jgi:hypothetical protein